MAFGQIWISILLPHLLVCDLGCISHLSEPVFVFAKVAPRNRTRVSAPPPPWNAPSGASRKGLATALSLAGRAFPGAPDGPRSQLARPRPPVFEPHGSRSPSRAGPLHRAIPSTHPRSLHGRAGRAFRQQHLDRLLPCPREAAKREDHAREITCAQPAGNASSRQPPRNKSKGRLQAETRGGRRSCRLAEEPGNWPWARHHHLHHCCHRLDPSSPALAEELSAATSYTEDDSYCRLCQEVLKTPVRTAACQHVFCGKCFLTALREGGIHCPLCRGNVTRRERACREQALDLENIMRKFSGSCRCCAKQIKSYHMRHHYKSCKKYQDEYGVSSIIPKFQISPDLVGNSNRSETSTSDNTETYQENTTSSGHPTFKCPLCQESNFTRQHLRDHCNSNHLFQIAVTCPICVSLPWGDPSQITRNFVSHLNQRHQFDYGEFVNLQLDEETQYQTAVEVSFQVNI
ncbi:LOW QUALITY PROTEIN: E3 ubiquitin-protein ligase RNF138-like [Trichechus inunguis]